MADTGEAYELVEVPERDGSRLIRKCDGKRIAFDYGEPEDRTFDRDLADLVDELFRLAALCAKHGIDIKP